MDNKLLSDLLHFRYKINASIEDILLLFRIHIPLYEGLYYLKLFETIKTKINPPLKPIVLYKMKLIYGKLISMNIPISDDKKMEDIYEEQYPFVSLKNYLALSKNFFVFINQKINQQDREVLYDNIIEEYANFEAFIKIPQLISSYNNYIIKKDVANILLDKKIKILLADFGFTRIEIDKLYMFFTKAEMLIQVSSAIFLLKMVSCGRIEFKKDSKKFKITIKRNYIVAQLTLANKNVEIFYKKFLHNIQITDTSNYSMLFDLSKLK